MSLKAIEGPLFPEEGRNAPCVPFLYWCLERYCWWKQLMACDATLRLNWVSGDHSLRVNLVPPFIKSIDLEKRQYTFCTIMIRRSAFSSTVKLNYKFPDTLQWRPTFSTMLCCKYNAFRKPTKPWHTIKMAVKIRCAFSPEQCITIQRMLSIEDWIGICDRHRRQRGSSQRQKQRITYVSLS